jgi:hypothetical protein
MGALFVLKSLYIHNNRLNGTIPASFDQLTALRRFWAHANMLTGVAANLSSLPNVRQVDGLILVPNNFKSLAWSMLSLNPIGTLNNTQLSNILSRQSLNKRQTLSSQARSRKDGLVSICALDDMKRDLMVGCLAELTSFCSSAGEDECQRAYGDIFSRSIYQPIGATCPAWRSGPNSKQCADSIKTFFVQASYTTITRTFAQSFRDIIFASPRYAPCTKPGICKWK